MKKFTLAFCVLLMSVSGFAYASDKKEALEVALSYGNSVHCLGVPFHENNPLRSVFLIDGGVVSSYAVLQYVDLYCSGGSGSGSYILTPVEQMGVRYAVNLRDYPSGNMFDSLNVKTDGMKNVTYNPTKKHLSFSTLEYGENDPNCCPSLEYQTTIDLKRHIVISRKIIGRR